jgi:diacylglycerol kinase (ATP)
MPPYKRAFVFQNPNSGSAKIAARADFRRVLESLASSTELVTLEEEGTPLVERVREAVADGADLVVAAGGDGTVRNVATALVGAVTPLGIVPLGTFNNFARSLNIPMDPTAAWQVILKGQTRSVDVGLANDKHHFFEAAGIGVDADLFPVGEEIKRGHVIALIRGVRLALAYQPSRLELRFDRSLANAYTASYVGQSALTRRRRRFQSLKRRTRLRCSFIAVANGPYYGGNFTISPNAVLDDGLFSIAVFRDFSRTELLWHFWSISRGRRQYSPKLEMFVASRLEVSAPKPLSVHVDGVPIGQTPARFVVLPRALNVLV